MTVLWVFLGGGLGALARYGLILALPRAATGFPWATLAANLLGSFLIGLLFVTLAERDGARFFLIVGLLGGFTTFSTLSFEVVTLIQARETAQALAYMGVTLGASLAACWLGLRLGGHA